MYVLLSIIRWKNIRMYVLLPIISGILSTLECMYYYVYNKWNIRMYVLLSIISGILECMYYCL